MNIFINIHKAVKLQLRGLPGLTPSANLSKKGQYESLSNPGSDSKVSSNLKRVSAVYVNLCLAIPALSR